ncbi:MAG: hypothetical protein F6K11_07325 [Leptolyngbya sp. SIO3F4]|nr:hypothetical protein [Leptolyngbya sp. SIO3F4]
MTQQASVAEINELLRDTNPFEKGLVVREQNIWGTSFPDIPELNQHVSDAIYEAIKKLQTAPSSIEKVSSMLIRAARGAGKTHVISRVRKHIQVDGKAVLIYASGDKFSGLELLDSSFRESVADSLDQESTEGLTQWQEIAAELVTAALKNNNKKAKVPSAKVLAGKFDQANKKAHQQGRDLIADLAKNIRILHPKADPYTIRAIIWTLSEERGALAVKWLAGEQLNTEDALDLRLPTNDTPETGKTEAKAIGFVSDVISLIGEYKSVLICFDELDNTKEDDLGFPSIKGYIDLIKRVYDSIVQSDTAQGILITTFLLPTGWQFLKQDGLDVDIAGSRIVTQNELPVLHNLNARTMVQLVSLWMKDFYKRRNITFSDFLYPFKKDELTEQGKRGQSVRQALKWCSEQLPKKLDSLEDEKTLESRSNKKLSDKERFDAAYNKILAHDLDQEDLGENSFTASILRFSFEKIIGLLEKGKLKNELIENVRVEKVEDVLPRSKNNGYLSFKVIGKENDQLVVIGVEVLQQTKGLTVGAGFRRLLNYEAFGLTRGCLVRSMERKIKRTWDSHEYYQQLIQKGGEWVHLKEDDLKPLLALKHVYDNHEKYDISIAKLDNFALTRNTLVKNPLIKEILSRPEGKVVEAALEGEAAQRLHSEQELKAIAETLDQTLEVLNQEEETDSEVDLSVLEVA